MNERDQAITIKGNPARPEGKEGALMLERMTKSHARMTSWALSHWEIDRDDVILDVGCGAGGALKQMSEAMGEEGLGELSGIDHSEVSVAEATKNNQKDIDSGKMEILLGSVEALPFSRDRFDKVLTVESFYFWKDPVQGLSEVRRVLKPEGIFFLVAEISGEDALNDEERANVERYHLNNPKRIEFEKMLHDAGFSRVNFYRQEGEKWILAEASGRKE